MKLISHRGNIDGKNSQRENSISYVEEALEAGYDVEVDVWYIKGNWFLGHDEPQYSIGESFLSNEKLWCHAKNIDSLEVMLQDSTKHCFWHQNDDVTLTSQSYIWTYPGKPLTSRSICVLPEVFYTEYKNLFDCAGICSDYISEYRQ